MSKHLSLLLLFITSLFACDEQSNHDLRDASTRQQDSNMQNIVDSCAETNCADLSDAKTTLDVGTDASDLGPITIDDSNLPNDAALYRADGQRFEVRQIATLLDSIISEQTTNLILYVHGRACGGGGEPKKSLGESVPEMIRDYEAEAIMLVWAGHKEGCPVGFPEDRARDAGPALAVVLGEIYEYKRTHERIRQNIKFTLITHSMGNFLLEEATEVAGVEQLPSALFESIVLNSAATEAEGHSRWLKNVTFGKHVYVTINKSDAVLFAAGVGRGTRLGRSIDNISLTPTIDYVDFSNNNVNHAYYLRDNQNGSAMKAFYQTIMRGSVFDFASSTGVESTETRDGAMVHTFNRR